MAPQAQSDLATAVPSTDVSHLYPTKKYDGNPDFVALVESMKLLGRQGFVDLLLEKGSRVIKRQGNGLHMAVAKMGWPSVIDKLIALGAKSSDKNSHGDTALHLAFMNGETDGLVDLLLHDYLSETKVNVENNDGLSFLHMACTRSNEELVQKLLGLGVDINCQVDLRSRSQYAGYSPLHFAVLFGKYDIAELLLSKGASIYVQDRTASTPVHLALNNADQRMIDLLLFHDLRTENCINNFGMTHCIAA